MAKALHLLETDDVCEGFQVYVSVHMRAAQVSIIRSHCMPACRTSLRNGGTMAIRYQVE